jgi:hypothetical protein
MHASSALRTIRDEHAALAAMLQSLLWLIRRGPGDDRARFFDTLRAMLFYIDEFPERLHPRRNPICCFRAWPSANRRCCP